MPASLKNWNSAAGAGGFAGATPVTIKAAAGAALRNYVTSVQFSAAAQGAAAELCIRDGSGGTVLWRYSLPTTGLPNGLAVSFESPLVGSTNTLLEVVALGATTGAIFFNAQGFVGS